MELTIAEARRKGDSEFSLRNKELCLLQGVFWDLEYGRSIFSETMNKFQSIIHYIRFDEKTLRQRR